MSHVVADKLSKETGYSVEWSPNNREYTIWPAGIPCTKPKQVRKVCRELEDAEMAYEFAMGV